jgi:fluoroacetyl-CoA thioesterase
MEWTRHTVDVVRVDAGARGELVAVVTDDDTATALGSGSLPVLATPRLLAWCEAACCLALRDGLGDGT